MDSTILHGRRIFFQPRLLVAILGNLEKVMTLIRTCSPATHVQIDPQSREDLRGASARAEVRPKTLQPLVFLLELLDFPPLFLNFPPLFLDYFLHAGWYGG